MTATADRLHGVLPEPRPGVPRRSVLLLGAVTVAVAYGAITPLAALVAVVPPVLVGLGEATGRRPLTLAGIVVSTLFVAQAPGGLRESLLVAVAAAGGMVVRLVVGGLRAPVHRAVPPLLLLLVVLLDQVLRPAVTPGGQYAVFEQGIVLITMIAVLVGGYREPDDVGRSESALHVALVTTALVSGADSLRALSVADPVALENRQVTSVFGASNYQAALLALAIVACVHRACTGTGRGWPNLVAAVAGVVMLAPQASRTSSIVVLLVVAWLLVRHGRWGWLLTAGAGVAAFVALTPSIALLDRFNSGEAAGDELNGRLELWNFALRLIRSDPVFGVGAGHVGDALHAAYFVPSYVHDVWLSLTAQFGLLGLAFLAVGTWWVVVAPLGRYARLLAVTSLLLSTVEPVVETLKMGLVFTAVIGLGAAHVAARSAESEDAG